MLVDGWAAGDGDRAPHAGALAAIEALRSSVPDAVVGVGTVMAPAQLSDALAAGAVFAVSPVPATCCYRPLPRCSVPFVPGVATVTELMRVVASGCREVKFFPAEASGGVATLSSLAAVAPSVRFLPTGGIDADSAAGYLALDHVFAVGGSWVCPAALDPRERVGSDRRARTRGIAAHRDRADVTLVLVVGEPLVELLEDPPGTPRRGFGGDALNLAVSLKRESPDARRASSRAPSGDGPDSEALLVLCRDEGIDVSLLRRVAGAELGRYRVTVDAAGERSFTYDRSASPFRGALDADDILPDGSTVDVLCFSGIAMAVLHDAGRSALLAYATAVHGRGGTVVYDPNHRPALWADDDEARAWTERIAQTVDMLLASTEDGRRSVGRRYARRDRGCVPLDGRA